MYTEATISIARDLNIDEKCLPALLIIHSNDLTNCLNERINIKYLCFCYPFGLSVLL